MFALDGSLQLLLWDKSSQQSEVHLPYRGQDHNGVALLVSTQLELRTNRIAQSQQPACAVTLKFKVANCLLFGSQCFFGCSTQFERCQLLRGGRKSALRGRLHGKFPIMCFRIFHGGLVELVAL